MVAIAAGDENNSEFQFYKGGVFAGCNSWDPVNHAVLVVGYGTDADSGEDYWLIKVGF